MVLVHIGTSPDNILVPSSTWQLMSVSEPSCPSWSAGEIERRPASDRNSPLERGMVSSSGPRESASGGRMVCVHDSMPAPALQRISRNQGILLIVEVKSAIFAVTKLRCRMFSAGVDLDEKAPAVKQAESCILVYRYILSLLAGAMSHYHHHTFKSCILFLRFKVVWKEHGLPWFVLSRSNVESLEARLETKKQIIMSHGGLLLTL